VLELELNFADYRMIVGRIDHLIALELELVQQLGLVQSILVYHMIVLAFVLVLELELNFADYRMIVGRIDHLIALELELVQQLGLVQSILVYHMIVGHIDYLIALELGLELVQRNSVYHMKQYGLEQSIAVDCKKH